MGKENEGLNTTSLFDEDDDSFFDDVDQNEDKQEIIEANVIDDDEDLLFDDVDQYETRQEIIEARDMNDLEGTENMLITQEDAELAESEEIKMKSTPVIQQAVGEAVMMEKERMQLEMNEVLKEEVHDKLDRYEKRRKRREIKETISGVGRLAIIAVLLIVVLGNARLRNKVITLAYDTVTLFSHIINGDEDISSNDLVNNLFDIKQREEIIYENEEKEVEVGNGGVQEL